MRALPLLLVIVFAVFGLTTHPATVVAATVAVNPLPAAPDCSAQSNNMASLGRPIPEARLLASSNPALTTPPPTPSGPTPTPSPTTAYVVQAGDTLSIIATKFQTTVAILMATNNLTNPNIIHRGQVLLIPIASNTATPGGAAPTPPPAPVAVAAKVSAPFEDVWVRGQAWQGEAAEIWVRVDSGVNISGKYGNQIVPFRVQCDLWWGLVAFDVLEAAGMKAITLTATASDGSTRNVSVPITLNAVNYWRGPRLQYPPDRQAVLDNKEIVDGENNHLNRLFAALPDNPPLWQGPFWKPINSVMTQSFGSIGLVNGVPAGYHEGMDLRARTPVPFYAPAPGVVILAENLTLRGNVIYIYHGAGVVSGFFHLSQIDVKVGDTVTTGQQLGLTGNTGLSTAPHLHWEMRVNGRYVNPVPWLTQSLP